MITIVHLVRKYWTVLGQLRGGHTLGVEGPRLVCSASPGLKQGQRLAAAFDGPH